MQLAQDEAQAAINNANKKIEELGAHSEELCAVLNRIQELFDDIQVDVVQDPETWTHLTEFADE